MGLPAAGDPVEDSSKRFANDVLKIEISGPEELHFSFADLPGLFHSKIEPQFSGCYLLCLTLTYVQIRQRSRPKRTWSSFEISLNPT